MFIRNVTSIFAILLALSSAGALAEEKAPRGYSYDTSPVELIVSGHRFRVPQNDLFQYVHGTTEQESFSLYLMVPELEGISERNFQCFITRMVCDKIVFVVLSNLVLPPASEQAEGLFSNQSTPTKEGPYGLTRYLDPESENYEDLYGKSLDGDQFYWIRCLKGSGALDECIYQQNLEQGVSLRYQFRRTQLES